jgi:hypothetical protein
MSGIVTALWHRSGRLVATARRTIRGTVPTLLHPRRTAAGGRVRGAATVSVLLRARVGGAIARRGRARVQLPRRP